MKYIFSAFALMFVGAAGWRIGGQLNSESLGMAVGILFGIMAGIPTALILLASQRRPEDERHMRTQRPRLPIEDKPEPPAQIVNNHYHYHSASNHGPLPKRWGRFMGEWYDADKDGELDQRRQLPGPHPYVDLHTPRDRRSEIEARH